MHQPHAPRTYRIAAEMMEKGIDAARINRLMFDTKSRPPGD